MNNLDNPRHVFIIAEAGSNWKCGTIEDDLQRSKELIQIASDAGADAVKFQTYKPETTYVSNAGVSKYLSKQNTHKNINEIFQQFSMPYEMIPELAKYCSQKNIMFMSTPFSVRDAQEIDPYVKIHKVASFEINHVRLLEYLSETKKPIIISTGASTYDEIDFAVNIVKKNQNNIALLQCTSKYPCSIESLNLLTIPEIKSKYGIPIGLSDHSLEPLLAPIMAVGLGATIIEKHFTVNKNLPGPDHSFALDPNELELMVKSIRNAELAKGTGKKVILNEEEELRQFATRSIQAITDIKRGEILQEGKNLDILRPGNRIRGLDARFLEKVIGKKALNDIKNGDGITNFE